MLNTLRARLGRDEGFTLVELLVVILIIGILAAIALPTFLGQQKKGQDASAKSNARNLLSHVESCYTTTQDYSQCATVTALTPDGSTGLPLVTGTPGGSTGQVGVEPGSTATSYKITAASKSGDTFSITKVGDGTISRTCTTAGRGSCPAGGSW